MADVVRSTDPPVNAGKCLDCGRTWGAANTLPTAKGHAERHRHRVVVEVWQTYRWGPVPVPGEDPQGALDLGAIAGA